MQSLIPRKKKRITVIVLILIAVIMFFSIFLINYAHERKREISIMGNTNANLINSVSMGMVHFIAYEWTERTIRSQIDLN